MKVYSKRECGAIRKGEKGEHRSSLQSNLAFDLQKVIYFLGISNSLLTNTRIGLHDLQAPFLRSNFSLSQLNHYYPLFTGREFYCNKVTNNVECCVTRSTENYNF